MKQKRGFYFVVFCVLLASVFVIEKDPCLRALGAFLVVSDDPRTADVIVVLGGAGGRVEQGVKLYKEGLSKFMIMTGRRKDPLSNMAEEMKQEAIQGGVPAGSILLEPRAEHTYQHPLFVRPIMDKHGFRSAIVVSSPYHMRRVAIIFDRAFYGSGIKLIYCPVVNSWFDSRHWWQTAEGRDVVLSEYAKMAVNFWGTGVSDFACALINKFKSL